MIRQNHQQVPIPTLTPAGMPPSAIVNPTAYDRFPTPQRQAWLTSLQSKIHRGLSGLPTVSAQVNGNHEKLDDGEDGWSEAPGPEEAAERAPYSDEQEMEKDDVTGDELLDEDEPVYNPRYSEAESDELVEDGSEVQREDPEGSSDEDELDREMPYDEDEYEEDEYDEDVEEDDMNENERAQNGAASVDDRFGDEAESEANSEEQEGAPPGDGRGEPAQMQPEEVVAADLLQPRHAPEVEMAQIGGFGLASQLHSAAADAAPIETGERLSGDPTSPNYPPHPQQTALDALLSNLDPALLPDPAPSIPTSTALHEMQQIDPQLLADLVQEVSNQAWNIDTFPPTSSTNLPTGLPAFESEKPVQEAAPTEENPFASFVLPSPSPLPPTPHELPIASSSMSREASGSGSRRDVIEFIDSDDEEAEEPVEEEADADLEDEEMDSEEEDEEFDEEDEVPGPVVVEDLSEDEEMPEAVAEGYDEIDEEEEFEPQEEDDLNARHSAELFEDSVPLASSAPLLIDASAGSQTRTNTDIFNSSSTRTSDDDNLPFLLRKGNLKSPHDKTYGLPVLDQADAAFRAAMEEQQEPADRVVPSSSDIAAHIASGQELLVNVPFGHHESTGVHDGEVPPDATVGPVSMPTAAEEVEQIEDLAAGPGIEGLTRESSPTPPPLSHLPDFSLPEDVEIQSAQVLASDAPAGSFETRTVDPVDALPDPHQPPPATTLLTSLDPHHLQPNPDPSPSLIVESPQNPPSPSSIQPHVARAGSFQARIVDQVEALPDPYQPPPATTLLTPLDPHHLQPSPDPTPSLIVEPPQNPPSPSSVQPHVTRAESPIQFPDPQAPPPDSTRPMPLSPGEMGTAKPLTPSLIVEVPQQAADVVMDDVIVSALPTPALDDLGPTYAAVEETSVTVITPGLELRMDAFVSAVDGPVVADMDEAVDELQNGNELEVPALDNEHSEPEIEEPVEEEESEAPEPIESIEDEESFTNDNAAEESRPAADARHLSETPSTEIEEEAEEEIQEEQEEIVELSQPAASSQRQTRSSARISQANPSEALEAIATDAASQPAPSSPAKSTRGKGRTASKSVEFDLPVETAPTTPSARGRGRGRGRGGSKQRGSTRSVSAGSLPSASEEATEALPTISEAKERRRSLRSSSKSAASSTEVDQGTEENDTVARHTRSSATPLVPPLALDTPAEEVENIVAIDDSNNDRRRSLRSSSRAAIDLENQEDSVAHHTRSAATPLVAPLGLDVPSEETDKIDVVDESALANESEPAPEPDASQGQAHRRSARRSHATAVDEAPYRPATPSDDEDAKRLPPKSPKSPRKTPSRRKDAVTPVKAKDFAEAPASRSRKRKHEAEQEAESEQPQEAEDVDMEEAGPEPAKRETRSAKKRAIEQEDAPGVPVEGPQTQPEAAKKNSKAEKPKSKGKKEEAKPELPKEPETPVRKTRSSWFGGLFSSKKK